MPVGASSQNGTAVPQVRLVLSTVFLVFLGQMSLNPVIAPLSREVGLAEWQVGAMISTAALTVVLTSQHWGRTSQSWGRKPVLVTAMSTAAAAMAAFAVLAGLGMSGLVSGTLLFALFLLTRGLLFGLAMAAVPPTAQAYIADVTSSERERVRGMAGIGAVQGMAMIGGALAGGALAGLGLIVSVAFVPVVLLAGALSVALLLRREPRHELVPDPPRVRPFDTRVWPFLLAGFGMFTALGFMQVVVGFMIQDRFGLDGPVTGVVTGAALLCAGVGLVLAQTVVVPRSRWAPRTLLRAGGTAASAGFVLLLPDAGIGVLLTGAFMVGFGLGVAMPGYTAGPSLLMRREEQGGLAGLIGANNGLTFVVAPTAATVLYGVWPVLPIMVSAAVMISVTVFVFAHPRFRAAEDSARADAR